jgi:hypothetical protein
MTSPTGPGPLSVGSPAAVLAIVPHLLGFAPAKSLVIIGAGPPRGRIHVTFRFDLPDPPDPDATAAIAAHAVTLLNRQELTTAIVIGYGPGPLVTPLADAIRDAVTRTDLQLRDVLRVDEGRYWSYLCREPSCCPPEGVPFDTTAHPAAATMAASGHEVLSDRDALAARIAPVTGSAAEAMTRETRRAERIAAQLMASTTGTESPARQRPVTDEGLTAVQAAISTYREGGSIEHYGQFAWLALVLTSLRIRDDAWARMDPDHRDAHLRLWTELTRHAQPGYIAAPASLLAFTAWQNGNGALANLALDRALADNPSYSMARLLRDVIDAGTPPSMARLPMTPEEVAASYSDADEQSVRQTGPCGPDAGDVDTDSIL